MIIYAFRCSGTYSAPGPTEGPKEPNTEPALRELRAQGTVGLGSLEGVCVNPGPHCPGLGQAGTHCTLAVLRGLIRGAEE